MSNGAQMALLLMMLILPLSALLARRVSFGSTVKMALAWTAIFAVATVLVAQRDRLRPIWQAVAGTDRSVAGEITRIAKDPDGHFYADVTIGSITRRMMIDSGATTTALSTQTARSAGISLDESEFPRMIDTANGQVLAQTATVPRLTLGNLDVVDLPVVVSDAFGTNDVIGMNFLSRLKTWRVEGDTLILEPHD